MTKSKLTLTLSLMLGVILMSPAGMAQSGFAATGEILAINNSMLNLSDVQFKLSPTVKVRLEEGIEGQLGDLKIGNKVGIKMIRLGNKTLVDSIHLVKETPANEDVPPTSK